MNMMSMPMPMPNPSNSRLYCMSVIDFEPEKLSRALFNVPLFRQNGFATVGAGKVPEKTLTFPLYLSLLERVELRKRIHFLISPKVGFGFFPAWDFDGPDLPYFGEYKGALKSTSIEAGPWSLDGRQLVADAKDRMLQAAEAVNIFWPEAGAQNKKIKIWVWEICSSKFINNRNWNMKDKIWQAFWSGVRKARETLATICTHVDFVAVTPSSDKTPFEWQDAEKRMAWCQDMELSMLDPECINVFLSPCDPFASLGSSPSEHIILSKFGFSSHEIVFPQFFQYHKSTWPETYRHKLWNPKDRLPRIMYSQHK